MSFVTCDFEQAVKNWDRVNACVRVIVRKKMSGFIEAIVSET
jgi:hypothetical protein